MGKLHYKVVSVNGITIKIDGKLSEIIALASTGSLQTLGKNLELLERILLVSQQVLKNGS